MKYQVIQVRTMDEKDIGFLVYVAGALFFGTATWIGGREEPIWRRVFFTLVGALSWWMLASFMLIGISAICLKKAIRSL